MRALSITGAAQRRHLCLAASALLAAPCLAVAEGAGASSPAALRAPLEVSAHLGTASLSGRATLRFLGLRIYEARLWVGREFAAAQYAAHAFALELVYARALSGADIAARSVDEMARVGSFTPQQGQTWRAAMGRAFPDVDAGDRITGLHQPLGPSRFFHNGQATQTIDGAAFARLFFGIWLAPQTSEPALRRQLLSLPA